MAPVRRSRGSGALVAVVLCVLLASSTVPASAALVADDARSAATTGTTMATAADTPDGLSVPAVTRVPQNGRVRIPVTVGNATRAVLVVGGPPFNYEVAATLADGDGDGRVDVVFEASAAGDPAEETLVAAETDDEVTGTGEETALTERIEPADYDLALVRGESADGPVHAEGTLVVEEAGRDPGTADGDERPARPPGGFGVRGGGSAWVDGAVPLDALGSLAIGVGLALVALGVLVAPGRI